MRTQSMSTATRPRLTTMITVGVSVTVLLTVLALLILVDRYALSYAEREAGQRLQQLSWQMRDALNRGVQKAGADVRLLSELPQLRAATSAADVRAVLDSLQRAAPDYAWIGMVGADGRGLAATQNLLEGVDLGQRTWFKGGRDRLYAIDVVPTSEPAIQPAVRPATQSPTEVDQRLPAAGEPWRFIHVAGPVVGVDGDARGVLCVRLGWGWARRLMHTVLAPAEHANGAEIFIVRADGQVMLGPQGTEQQRLQTDSLLLSRSGKTGAVRETWSDDRAYLSGYSLTGQAGDAATLPWSVIVRQPLAVALADARALERQILLLGAILGLTLTAFAALVARRYTRPFNQLSAQIEQRSGAPADAIGLPDIATVDSFHELQVLSSALARMVHKEQQHLATLRALNEQLETTVAERTGEIASKALQLEHALAQEYSSQLLLQERAAELRAILDNTHDAFIALDQCGVVLDWNRQAEKLIGWTRAEVVGQPLGAMVLPPLLRRASECDLQLLAERGPDHEANPEAGSQADTDAGAGLSRRLELTLHHRDGRELPVEASVAYVPRNGGHVFIAFLHDISERKTMIASLEDMALRDTLTKLPNRRALMLALPAALMRAQRSGQRCAVFFLDLDRFKQVNDRYGHEQGDELLRQFADRVRGGVRKTDTVGRLAGDEFIVIVEMLGSDAVAYDAADKLGALLRQPFRLTTTTVALGASIGVAIHQPDDPQDIELLLGRADRAMYAIKRQHQRQHQQADEPYGKQHAVAQQLD